MTSEGQKQAQQPAPTAMDSAPAGHGLNFVEAVAPKMAPPAIAAGPTAPAAQEEEDIDTSRAFLNKANDAAEEGRDAHAHLFAAAAAGKGFTGPMPPSRAEWNAPRGTMGSFRLGAGDQAARPSDVPQTLAAASPAAQATAGNAAVSTQQSAQAKQAGQQIKPPQQTLQQRVHNTQHQRENPRGAARKRLKGISGLVTQMREEGNSSDSTAKATSAAVSTAVHSAQAAANSVQSVVSDLQSVADSLLAAANGVRTAGTQASVALQLAQSTAEKTDGARNRHAALAQACQEFDKELKNQP